MVPPGSPEGAGNDDRIPTALTGATVFFSSRVCARSRPRAEKLAADAFAVGVELGGGSARWRVVEGAQLHRVAGHAQAVGGDDHVAGAHLRALPGPGHAGDPAARPAGPRGQFG